MKKIILLSLFALFAVPSGFLKAVEMPAGKVPPEILEKPFLYEVTRYLYRWYLDEIDIESITEKDDLCFRIRKLNPKLDEGDKSQYVEIIIPSLKLSIKMKKSDYRIEELNALVKSNSFKINNVSRYEKEFEIPEECITVNLDIKDMKAYLFKTRNQAEFPSPELYARVRKAFREEFGAELLKKLPAVQIKKEWVTFIAPLSPVANEFWAFWENGKYLVRCSSDIDLVNSDVWEHESLKFRIYDVLNQMVLSLNETGGDNSFMTRDQIGRALYNCVVLGERLIVPPQLPPPEEKP